MTYVRNLILYSVETKLKIYKSNFHLHAKIYEMNSSLLKPGLSCTLVLN